jgi:hypothetical protein
MVDQRGHPFHEPNRMRQRGVQIERGLDDPARMDVEQPRVAGRGEAVDPETPASARDGASTSTIAAATLACSPSRAWKRAKMNNSIWILRSGRAGV